MYLYRDRKVLVLDNDIDSLRKVAPCLSNAEVTVFACRDEESAQAIIGAFELEAVVTELTISNLGGPEGLRLVRYLCCHFPQTRVVIFSERLDAHTRQLALMLGASGILHKGCSLGQLRAAVFPQTTQQIPRSPSSESAEVILVETLEEILSRRSVQAVYQPIFRLNPVDPVQTPVGLEVLGRGPHGSPLERPEVLLRYATEKQQLIETELLLTQMALQQLPAVPSGFLIFLNFSPTAVSSPRLVWELQRVIADSKVDASQIVLEVSERQSAVNARSFFEQVQQLRAQGVRIALDAFGSGVSNANLLLALKPDFIKLSGRFLKGLQKDQRRREIVQSIMRMASELEIDVIGGQLESDEDTARASQLGLKFGQGYHLGRPTEGKLFREEFLH